MTDQIQPDGQADKAAATDTTADNNNAETGPDSPDDQPVSTDTTADVPAESGDGNPDTAGETADGQTDGGVDDDPNRIEIVVPGDDQRLEHVAQGLLASAEALGLHPHSVDYQPRLGGFAVPLQVAQAYASQQGDLADHGPVAAPRQQRTATVKKAAKKTAPRKAAAKKAAADKASEKAEGGGQDG